MAHGSAALGEGDPAPRVQARELAAVAVRVDDMRRVDFNLPAPVDVMIDGEIATLQIRSLDIVPGAVDVHI